MISDSKDEQLPPVPPPPDLKLGGIADGPYDTTLGGASVSGSKPGKPISAAPPAQDDERLRLPRGAFVIMRMSGGLRFSSRTVAVYRDGRVTLKQIGGFPAEGSDKPLPLGESQLAELHKLLVESNLPRLPSSSGHQPPDAFSYEIVGRPGRRAYQVEVFDGSIPASLVPLIELLRRIMAGEREEDTSQ